MFLSLVGCGLAAAAQLQKIDQKSKVQGFKSRLWSKMAKSLVGLVIAVVAQLLKQFINDPNYEGSNPTLTGIMKKWHNRLVGQ